MNDKVLIIPIDRESVTVGGIVIPDSVKEDLPERGKVVHKGESTSVDVGDTVLFSKYGYDEFTVEGQTYYVVSDKHILATL